MTIECHRSECPFHSCHANPDDGPFCYEYACIRQPNVKRYLQLRAEMYPDLTATQLAEDATHYFNHDEWLDEETHWIWDLAAEAKYNDPT